MLIADGTGKGKLARVDDENYLRVHSVMETLAHHANDFHGDAYSVTFNQSPTAGDDCIFYMVNSDSNTDIIITGMWLGFINATAVDAEVYFKLGAKGTRNSATVLTPANLKSASGNAADGTFEKGADLDGGAATLTGGAEIERHVFADVQNQVSAYYDFKEDLVLAKNETFTIWATDAGATYYATVVFIFHQKED